MRKVLSLILISLIFAASFAINISAAPQNLEVPMASTTPTLDGKISDGEWDNALVVEMKKGDTNLFVAPTGTLNTFNGATFRFLWSENGIYFAADVPDNTAPKNKPATNSGSYNSGDGIQFNIYTSSSNKDSNPGELLFFSFNPKTDQGAACVGEHFVYGDGTSGADVPSAKLSSLLNGEAYVIEGLIPAEAFAKVSPSLTIAEGAKFYMNTVVMEMDADGNQSLIIDNEWLDGSKANIYTLVGSKTADTEDDTTAETTKDTTKDTTSDTTKNDTKSDDKSTTDNNDNSYLLYIGIAAAVVVVVGIVILVVLNKKKKK